MQPEMLRPDRFKLNSLPTLNQGSGLSNEQQQLLKVGHVPGWRGLENVAGTRVLGLHRAMERIVITH
jgi:hypothetical protein